MNDEHTELLIRIDQKVNGINQRLDVLNGRVGKAENKLHAHDERFIVIETKAETAKEQATTRDKTVATWLKILSLVVTVVGILMVFVK